MSRTVLILESGAKLPHPPKEGQLALPSQARQNCKIHRLLRRFHFIDAKGPTLLTTVLSSPSSTDHAESSFSGSTLVPSSPTSVLLYSAARRWTRNCGPLVEMSGYCKGQTSKGTLRQPRWKLFGRNIDRKIALKTWLKNDSPKGCPLKHWSPDQWGHGISFVETSPRKAIQSADHFHGPCFQIIDRILKVWVSKDHSPTLTHTAVIEI